MEYRFEYFYVFACQSVLGPAPDLVKPKGERRIGYKNKNK